MHACQRGHVTAVPPSVLWPAPPEHQRGVAAGDLLRGDTGPVVVVLPALLVLVPLVLLFVLVVILLFLLAARRQEAEHRHFLSEPADGVVAGGLEGAGQEAVLGDDAGHMGV